MAADRRKANIRWDVADENGAMPTWERVGIAVLMDIRDELQRLNGLLHCSNFQNIPRTLKGIQRKLPTPARKDRG